MGVLPNNRRDQLRWFETRVGGGSGGGGGGGGGEGGWVEHAAEIGLSEAQATALAALVAAARQAATAADTARAASKAATETYYNAVAALLAPGRASIATIKAFAEATQNPAVYSIARVSPPAAASAPQPPAVPTNVRAAIAPTGAVTLEWDAAASGATTGVFFLIARKRGGAGEEAFSITNATPSRAYTDADARLWAGPVLYQLRAQRGDLVSDWTVPVAVTVSDGESAMTMAAPSRDVRRVA